MLTLRLMESAGRVSVVFDGDGTRRMTVATAVGRCVAEPGAGLFSQVFGSSEEGRDMWTEVRDRLPETRIEVGSDLAGAALPWELMRDPETGRPLAACAASFVRVDHRPARPYRLPTPDGPELRVLMVIGGQDDAPYRSAAAYLLRHREEPRQAVTFDVLRPPAFARLGEALRLAADEGRPYHAVHIDGRLNAYDPALGQLLAQVGVPVLVLNACRPGETDAVSTLAHAVAHAGVPGVVALPHNADLAMAAQGIADLYGALLAGRSLGAAVTAARALFTAEPDRAVVYEAAPLTLVAPSQCSDAPVRVRPEDVSFLGRDETLLAIDRAFDAHSVVLLHASTGAGKTSTATEFARWYRRSGGLPGGVVLVSSFEQPLPLARLLDQVGAALGPSLEAIGLHWPALDDERRRQAAVEVLNRVPVLWIWDNVEDERPELRDFLRELAGTQARVLLTSRDEGPWLGDLPARIQLPPLPMPARLRLAEAIAARCGEGVAEVEDWLPLLDHTDGNPLMISLLVNQVLREGLTSAAQIDELVARLRASETGFDDRALAAAFSYVFTRTFDGPDRARLAVLHLFRQNVDTGALVVMGLPESEETLTELAGASRESVAALLERAAGVGLLTPIGGGYFRMHPALPRYLTAPFADAYASPDDQDARRAVRAYVVAMAALGEQYWQRYAGGDHEAAHLLELEEGNLRGALARARRRGWWAQAMSCMRGLHVLYETSGRGPEWARLVSDLTSDLIDPLTGGPRAGCEEYWSRLNDYRVDLALRDRDWPAGERLLRDSVAWNRARVATASIADAPEAYGARSRALRSLVADLRKLGRVLRQQGRAECVPVLLEAIDVAQWIASRRDEAIVAHDLGRAYLDVPELRDLDEAERWYRRTLELCEAHDRTGRAKAMGRLGDVALRRFREACDAGRRDRVRTRLLKCAEERYLRALDLLPAEDAAGRAAVCRRLGGVYDAAGQTDTALAYYARARLLPAESVR